MFSHQFPSLYISIHPYINVTASNLGLQNKYNVTSLNNCQAGQYDMIDLIMKKSVFSEVVFVLIFKLLNPTMDPIFSNLDIHHDNFKQFDLYNISLSWDSE